MLTEHKYRYILVQVRVYSYNICIEYEVVNLLANLMPKSNIVYYCQYVNSHTFLNNKNICCATLKRNCAKSYLLLKS